MAKLNRAEIIKRLQKVLKKHFSPVPTPADRTVLEHLLFACCLEDARHELAEECFARVQQLYFDWNEIRVTSTRELSEVFSSLPDPQGAAMRMRTSLQSIFENRYEFDLEFLRKIKLQDARKKLASFKGPTLFVQAYVTQAALAGHTIPTSEGALQVIEVVGAATSAEVAAGEVPGLERVVSKNQGAEFSSLLHALGALFKADPFGAKVREYLVEVNPDAAERIPKRTSRRPAQPQPPEAPDPPHPATEAAVGGKGPGSKGTSAKASNHHKGGAKPTDSASGSTAATAHPSGKSTSKTDPVGPRPTEVEKPGGPKKGQPAPAHSRDVTIPMPKSVHDSPGAKASKPPLTEKKPGKAMPAESGPEKSISPKNHTGKSSMEKGSAAMGSESAQPSDSKGPKGPKTIKSEAAGATHPAKSAEKSDKSGKGPATPAAGKKSAPPVGNGDAAPAAEVRASGAAAKGNDAKGDSAKSGSAKPHGNTPTSKSSSQSTAKPGSKSDAPAGRKPSDSSGHKGKGGGDPKATPKGSRDNAGKPSAKKSGPDHRSEGRGNSSKAPSKQLSRRKPR